MYNLKKKKKCDENLNVASIELPREESFRTYE